jgi:hypothetical protein
VTELIMAAMFFVLFFGVGLTVRILEEWNEIALAIFLVVSLVGAVVRVVVVGAEPIAAGIEERLWLIPVSALAFFCGDFCGKNYYRTELKPEINNLSENEDDEVAD